MVTIQCQSPTSRQGRDGLARGLERHVVSSSSLIVVSLSRCLVVSLSRCLFVSLSLSSRVVRGSRVVGCPKIVVTVMIANCRTLSIYCTALYCTVAVIYHSIMLNSPSSSHHTLCTSAPCDGIGFPICRVRGFACKARFLRRRCSSRSTANSRTPSRTPSSTIPPIWRLLNPLDLWWAVTARLLELWLAGVSIGPGRLTVEPWFRFATE